MRIAFLVDAFPSLSETFILNQVTGLLDLGHDVEIFAAQRGSLDAIQEEVAAYRLLDRTHYHNEVPEIPFRRFLRFLSLLRRDLFRHPAVSLRAVNGLRLGREALSLRPYFRASLFLRRGPFDILQCHFGRNGMIGAALKELGIPGRLVTMFHGYDIRLGLREGGQIYRRLFRRGDCFLAISQANREHLIRFGADPEKIRYHPVGIDFGRFAPSFAADEVPAEGEVVRVLTVARLVKEKGLDDGIRAVAGLLQDRPGLRLEYRIIGDGPEKPALLRLVDELKIGDAVRLLGPRPQRDVLSAMRGSHLFLLPSREEVLPVVLMEALASGLPVVATSVGSVAEIVQDGLSGHLVPPGDTQAMSLRLGTFLDHPGKGREMAARGRKDVAERFDIRRWNPRLVRIYETLR